MSLNGSVQAKLANDTGLPQRKVAETTQNYCVEAVNHRPVQSAAACETRRRAVALQCSDTQQEPAAENRQTCTFPAIASFQSLLDHYIAIAMAIVSAKALLPLLMAVSYAIGHASGAEAGFGRATFYGEGDGFTLNDGSCACHKQDSKSSWLSSQCAEGFCFDYIGTST